MAVHIRNVFLLLTGIAVLVSASLTIHPDQRYHGWVLLAVFAGLFCIKKWHTPYLRIVTLMLGAYITLRYFLFRCFYTLSLEGSIAVGFALLLFIAECYAVLVHLLSLFVNISPREREVPPLPAKLPSIDVFIPTFNEDEDVALTTALACKNFDYPEELVNIYILNDGGRLPRLNNPELREQILARHEKLRTATQSIGVRYLTRADGFQAKAGMLNAAFKGQAFCDIILGEDGTYHGSAPVETTGDLILILDCDHIPTKDMLRRCVGHFSDDNIALVQTPHFMINADPIRRNLGNEAVIPCESWLFYKAIQKGLDRWNTSFFCGSAAFLRRKILADMGGLCGETITEDSETAMAIHAQGYGSVYVDTPMVAGLAPESLEVLLSQRVRWCQGMIQLFILKNPLFRRGLSWPQRLCYLNCCLYWFFPLPRLAFFAAPLMFLFFNLNVYNASLEQVVSFSGPHIVASAMCFAYQFGKLRPLFLSEVLETIQTFRLLPAIFSVFLKPRKPEFKTTLKGITQEYDRPSPLGLVFWAVISLLIFGFMRAAYIVSVDPYMHDALMVTAFWNSINFVIFACCIAVLWERRQVRKAHRFPILQPEIQNVTINGHPAILTELSGNGFQLHMPGSQLIPGEPAMFACGDFSCAVRIVRREGERIGGSFEATDKKALVGFIYGDSARWQSLIDRVLLGNTGFLMQSYTLLRLAFTGAWRHVKFIFSLMRKFLFILLFCMISTPAAGYAESVSIPLAKYILNERLLANFAETQTRIPLYFPPRAQISEASLILVHQNAAILAQEQTKITVYADEASIPGTRFITGSGEARTSFILPKTFLRSGTRMLTLVVEQTLSKEQEKEPGKSQKFWTEFDLGRSTVNIEYTLENLNETTAHDVQYLFADVANIDKKVHFVMQKVEEHLVERALKAAQALAIQLGNRPMFVSVSAAARQGMDNIYIGDDTPPPPPGPKFAMLTEKDLEKALPSRKTVLTAGSTYTFKEFGVSTMAFKPSTSTQSVNFYIPSNMRSIPNKKMILSLNMGYSSGLHADSRLEVYMNGKTVTWIHLENSKGAESAKYQVEVPLDLLEKGENTVGFNPILTAQGSDDWNTTKDGNLFVVLFNTSTITRPDTGTYSRLPELASFFIDGFPLEEGGQIQLPAPTDTTVAAYLNVAALVGQKRGTVRQKAQVNFGPWSPSVQGKNTVIFDVDHGMAGDAIQVYEDYMPKESSRMIFQFSAPTEEMLLQGAYRFWDTDVQKRIQGGSIRLNLATGDLITSPPAQTRIFTSASPFPGIVYYANNYPLYANSVFVCIFLLFCWLVSKTLSGRRP